MGNGATKCGWCHAPEAHGGFGGFWKGQFVELRTRHPTRWVNFRGSQRPYEFARYGHRTRWGSGRWKSQNRKNVYLSPYVEESLNSKVIKSFVSELRSRYVFFEFRDSCVLCIYVVNDLCTFHVAISWLCNKFFSSTIQLKRFSTKVFAWSSWENKFSFRAFCRKWKRWKSLAVRSHEIED